MQELLTPLARHLTKTAILRPTERALHIGMRNGFLGAVLREFMRPKYLDGLSYTIGERTILWNLYDRYWTGDASAMLLNESHKYDVIVITDWIEHMEKENAKFLMGLAREKSKRLIFAYENQPGLTRWHVSDLAPYVGTQIAGDGISWGAWEAP